MHWLSLLSPQRTSKQKKIDQSTFRSAFERDYDRIIFSHPFRRLQDKTQVHPLPEHDFVHTRLTHSLEVSSVGRSLGKKVGEAILQRHSNLSQFSSFDFGSIVAAASLAHDLGNPPFGHSGEDGISDFFIHHPQGVCFKPFVSPLEWEDLIRFEGNAQGFRVLNTAQNQGLELTYATLGAFTKYPCPSLIKSRHKQKKSQQKYGFFQTEQTLFSHVATSLELNKVEGEENVWSRHPLAFLVEAADDICYNIIDLEDGCRLGLVSFDDTVDLFSGILQTRFDRAKLNLLHGQDQKIGVLRALAINKLIEDCTTVFLAHEQEILESCFDTSLLSLCDSAKALEQIAAISREKIYRAQHMLEIETAGYTALSGLLEEFIEAGKNYIEQTPSHKHSCLIRLLPVEIKAKIDEEKKNSSMYHMLRSIVDFISGMTDRRIFSLYRKIKGVSF